MNEALKEAARAASLGEVPVGAVIARDETIIGRGHNTTEQDNTVIAHAETHAIQEASRTVGDWRLADCIMCVTLEPCTMCTGAIRLARIPIVVFGAGDSKQGAMGSLYDLSLDDRLGTPPRVISGILKDECENVLKRFFESLRR
jgi:tRNA(adenine34) deaminase